VYVEVPGQLVELGVKAGDTVKKGDLIARLENIDLKLQIAQLEGERDAYQVQIESLAKMQFKKSDDAVAQINVYRERLAGVEAQLHEKHADLDRLKIVAPRDGVVIPPPRTPEKPVDDDAELPTWTGTPLDKKNLGATFSPLGQQNLVCQIGDPNEWDAVLVIDQDDVALVRDGQEVRLMFEESAYHVFVSTLVHLNNHKAMPAVSPRLASTNGGPLAVEPKQDGSMRPLNTSFQAIARLDNPDGMLRNGLIGRARIETEPRTLAWRLMRYLGRTFNFDI
jgi:putative peptide zinc metalloprotease protein